MQEKISWIKFEKVVDLLASRFNTDTFTLQKRKMFFWCEFSQNGGALLNADTKNRHQDVRTFQVIHVPELCTCRI